jgi:hypothetical protein
LLRRPPPPEHAIAATMLGPIRANRATVLVLAAVFFLAAFVGLAYNHVETWDIPAGFVPNFS